MSVKSVKEREKSEEREKRQAEEKVRLDVLLVRKGLFSSRERAKEAIRRGFVFVNGEKCVKPAKIVSSDAEIIVKYDDIVLASDILDVPRGFWKLKEIDERFKIIKNGDVVLDLGSSAGGFLLYASEKARKVYGIEYSREFEGVLREIERKRRNVKVFIDDVFHFDIHKIEDEYVDVILNDLTLDFASSITALRRFLPKLKQDGRILFVHKTGSERKRFGDDGDESGDVSEEFEEVENAFKQLGLRVVARLQSNRKKENYYLICPF